jgi:hypothetical protein
MRAVRFIVSSCFDDNILLHDFAVNLWNDYDPNQDTGYTPKVSVGALMRFYAQIELDFIDPQKPFDWIFKFRLGQFVPFEEKDNPFFGNPGESPFYNVARIHNQFINIPDFVPAGRIKPTGLDHAHLPTLYYRLMQENNKLYLEAAGYFQVIGDLNGYLSRGDVANTNGIYSYSKPSHTVEPISTNDKIVFDEGYLYELKNKDRNSVYHPSHYYNYRLFRLHIEMEDSKRPGSIIQGHCDKGVSFKWWNVDEKYEEPIDIVSAKIKILDDEGEITNLLSDIECFQNIFPSPDIKYIYPHDFTRYFEYHVSRDYGAFQTKHFSKPHLLLYKIEFTFTIKDSVIIPGNKPLEIYAFVYRSSDNIDRPKYYRIRNNKIFRRTHLRFAKLIPNNTHNLVTHYPNALQYYPPDINYFTDYGGPTNLLNRLHGPISITSLPSATPGYTDYTVTYYFQIYNYVYDRGSHCPKEDFEMPIWCPAFIVTYYPYPDADRKRLAKTYSFNCNIAERKVVPITSQIKEATPPKLIIYFRDQVNLLASDAIQSSPEERLNVNFEFYAEPYEKVGNYAREKYGIDMLKDLKQFEILVYHRDDENFHILERHIYAKDLSHNWDIPSHAPVKITFYENNPRYFCISYTFRNRFEANVRNLSTVQRGSGQAAHYASLAMELSQNNSFQLSNQDWSKKDIYIDCVIVIRDKENKLEDKYIAQALNRVRRYDHEGGQSRKDCLAIKFVDANTNISNKEQFDNAQEYNFVCQNDMQYIKVAVATRCDGYQLGPNEDVTNDCDFRYLASLFEPPVYSVNSVFEYENTAIRNNPGRGRHLGNPKTISFY